MLGYYSQVLMAAQIKETRANSSPVTPTLQTIKVYGKLSSSFSEGITKPQINQKKKNSRKKRKKMEINGDGIIKPTDGARRWRTGVGVLKG